ncbi:hypothetical protein G6F49_011972 [Rhizopus delemar]|nr:hypothetical protein G6F49_011972 [Rhizopus delemar]
MSDLYFEPYVTIVSRNNSSEFVDPIVAINTRTRLREDEAEHIVRPVNALSVLDRQRYFNSQASMGVEEFVDYPSNAGQQISNDIFKYILGCVYDGASDQLSPAFVDNMCETVHGEVSISTDIDSFAYVSHDVPLRNSCGLIIRPLHASSYMSDTGVTWSHDVYTKNVSVGIHRIPNLQLLKSGQLQVCICFPRIYQGLVLTEGVSPSYHVPDHYRVQFVDLVLLPALDIAFDTSVVPVPLDYESAAHFGLGKGIHISMQEFTRLETAMRDILLHNSRLNSVFGDFFFVTWGMGMKSRFSEEETFMDALTSQGFIWDRVDVTNFYLDLGVNFGCPQRGLTGMWSTGNSTNFRAIIDNFLAVEEKFLSSKYRHDPFCDHLGIGGFKYANPKSDFIRVTAYSHSKEPFYRRSAFGERHGQDFQPDEVFKTSEIFMKHVNRKKHCLSLMTSKSYGVRLEVRFKASSWDTLYNRTMELAKNSLPGHINWYKSKALWCYVEKRLDALVALAKNMNSQKNCRYTARQLTGVALIAFMLSSLVHRPSDRSWWKPFSDQLKSHRCRKSMALFVPGLFQLSEDGSQWSCAISMKQYLHGVFHEGIIQKILHDHDYVAELPEWHYKLPILLEKNIAVNNLNLDLGLYDQYIDLVNKSLL